MKANAQEAADAAMNTVGA
ncbi:hypothetical protein A2U01_0112334, partial [Trifolium medium]|nr:hypothetical protein [Trifolium medium]